LPDWLIYLSTSGANVHLEFALQPRLSAKIADYQLLTLIADEPERQQRRN